MAKTPRVFVGKVLFGRALERKSNPVWRNAQITKPGRNKSIFLAEKDIARIKRSAQIKRDSNRTITNKNMLDLYSSLKDSPIRHFTSRDIVASLAFTYGLDSAKLLPHINAMVSIQRLMAKRGASPILGTFENYAKVIKSGALENVNKVLLSSSPLTSKEISSRFNGLNSNTSHALLILESMNLAYRLPQETLGSGGQAFRWVRSEQKFSPLTLPKQNLAFRCLMRLSSNPVSYNSLAVKQEIFKNSIGSENGISTAHTLRYNLDLLEREKLVEHIKQKGRSKSFYRLTPIGVELVEQQKKLPFLHPKIRKVLLGEPIRRNPSPVNRLRLFEQRKLQRIEDYINLRLAYEKAPRKIRIKRGSRFELATMFDVSLSKVKHVSMIKQTP